MSVLTKIFPAPVLRIWELLSPSEVEQVRKGLVSSGMWQRNSTALNALKNFDEEVDRRAAFAYKVRGAQPPAGMSGYTPEQEAMIQKVMSANPGASEEDVVRQLRKEGRMR